MRIEFQSLKEFETWTRTRHQEMLSLETERDTANEEVSKHLKFINGLQSIIGEELKHPTEKNAFLEKLTKYISDRFSDTEEGTRFIGFLPEIDY